MQLTAIIAVFLLGFTASLVNAQKTPEEMIDELNRLPVAERQRRLEEAAKKEREVVWYSTMNRENSNEVIRAFESDYPYLKVASC